MEQEQVTEAPEAREDPAEVGAAALTTDLVEPETNHPHRLLKVQTEEILLHLVLAHFKVAAVEEQVKRELLDKDLTHTKEVVVEQELKQH